ncbi:GH1 family beta-glucosidase [Arthrobacter sp. 35W]|uniref:GH1 family beta-glucosidase n=1 Tax=Arthrobacter sp. 35W TaxID=1132441 RepID=UPI00041FA6DB|nr:GH1 family beta-glucosidase [Arthrobacter sp. 35W]
MTQASTTAHPELSARATFPAGFAWGVATAAYQIEGAVAEGGRGPSIWDSFSHQSGTTIHGDTGDIACDHYHRWEGDLDLMAELGIPSYRLSLSWSRLQPTGTGPLNPEGVAFYRNLLAGCAARGITPYVTLYHWDLPQPLQDDGGWPARHTASRFGDYAGLVADALGHLAEHWITINEPMCAAFLGHSWGMQAPGSKDDRLAVRAAHHLLLAHGLALAAFRERRPEAKVGITNIIGNLNPATQSEADRLATEHWDAVSNRIFLDPVYRGRYADSTVAAYGQYGLTATGEGAGGGDLVQPGDLALISAPGDFAGINHYTNMLVAAGDDTGTPNWQHVRPTPSSFGWSDTPEALKTVLKRVASEYTSLPLYVTENGITLHDYVDPNGEVRDTERIHYLRGYISAVGEAIADGVDVRGYFAWSFMDNFEWAEGYDKRFGLVFVDYGTQRRIPKQSAHWYGGMIAAQQDGVRPARSTAGATA